jgi:hypothetical protein
MANVRASNKRKLNLWMTRDQVEQLRVVAKTLGYTTVTDLFIAVSKGEVAEDLRPKFDRDCLYVIYDEDVAKHKP